MLIIGLGVLFVLLLLVCIFSYREEAKKERNGEKGTALGGIITLGILLLLMFIIVPANYAANSVRVAELDAFQKANVQNFAVAPDKTSVILSEEKFLESLIAGSIEKTEVGKSIAQQIVEWRDATNAYNIEVAHKQKMRTLWLYPGWAVMPAEVNELPLLTIG